MTPDPRPRSGWFAIGAAAVVIALVLGVQWSRDEDGTDDAASPVAASERSDSPFGTGPAAPPAVLSADTASPTKQALATNGPIVVAAPSSSGAPPGMTPAQWRQLNEALRDHPGRDVEIARISDYMAFTARVEHFHTQRTVGASRATLEPLVQQLTVDVAERLDRGELPMSEAEELMTELFETLEPDLSKRELALVAWRSEHATAPREPDPREADFVRQQTAAIEAWQALPAEQRDAQQLEAQLQAIRSGPTAPKP